MPQQRELISRLEEEIKRTPGGFKFAPIVPFVSGSTALFLLNKVISSDLSDLKFGISIVAILLIFFASCWLFYALKKTEKDKDQYLLSTVGKIVEDVFAQYGVAMASHAAGPTIAGQMNPTMQTIVRLVEGLQKLMEKNYTRH